MDESSVFESSRESEALSRSRIPCYAINKRGQDEVSERNGQPIACYKFQRRASPATRGAPNSTSGASRTQGKRPSLIKLFRFGIAQRFHSSLLLSVVHGEPVSEQPYRQQPSGATDRPAPQRSSNHKEVPDVARLPGGKR